MRIGLVIYGSLDLLTGGFIYDRHLVTHLLQEGHEVEIFALPWMKYPGQLANNFNHTLVNQIKASSPDLLLQDELCHPALFNLNKNIKRAVPVPLVSIVHHLRSSELHSPLLTQLYKAVETRYLSTIDAWIFNSETTRQSVKQRIKEDQPYVIGLPSGSRFSGLVNAQIEQRFLKTRPLNIIFVGSVIRRKGLDTLLKAVGHLRKHLPPAEMVNLTIIGNISADKSYTRLICQQINKLGLENNVTLTGVLSDKLMENYLAEADVMAVPSTYEGFGIVYLEGMAFGLPAIATTGGAAHEIITHGVNGYLIPPDDSTMLARHLLHLHSDRQQLHAMSQAARKRWETHPSWTDTMSHVEEFLCNLHLLTTPAGKQTL